MKTSILQQKWLNVSGPKESDIERFHHNPILRLTEQCTYSYSYAIELYAILGTVSYILFVIFVTIHVLYTYVYITLCTFLQKAGRQLASLS